MAIITAEQLQVQAGRSFDDDDWALADEMIAYVQGEAENFLNRPIEVRTITEHRQVPVFETTIYLSGSPVQSVSAVSTNGQALDPAWWFVAPWGITLLGWGYTLPTASPGWLSPTQDVAVTYIGGLDGPNIPGLKAIIIRTVLNQMAKVALGDAGRLGASEIRVEDFVTRFDPVVVSGVTGRGVAAGEGPFSAQDIRALAGWKRRTVVTAGNVAASNYYQPGSGPF